MEFDFNDYTQTIMNIHIKNPDCYYNVRDAMHYNVMEGWQPTQQDVLDLINEWKHPDPQAMKLRDEMFGQK